jgi:hypothetical protein
MTVADYAELGFVARAELLRDIDHADTVRDRQQLAAAALISLLAVPAPEVAIWCIEDQGRVIAGQSATYSLDSTVLALHRWAAVLDGAHWEITPYTHERYRGKARLAVHGTRLDVNVMIWDQIDLPDGVDPDSLLADLSAPYTDSTGEGTAEADRDRADYDDGEVDGG